VLNGRFTPYRARMSVADVPRPTTARPAAPPSPPAATPAYQAHVAPTPAHRAPWTLPAPRPAFRRDGLSSEVGRLLAGAFALAWIVCATVEPMPTGEIHYPLWQLPVDLAALATIVVAVRALWRGSRNSARLGMAAGVMMAVETIMCPIAGHTPVGWWTWVQTGLSLMVMATSAALHRRQPGTDPLP
jgi:hypothetical protein